MGYSVVCPGFDGVVSAVWQCEFKKRYGGLSSDVSDSWYEKFCCKDYERGGYGDCEHYQKYLSKCYIVTAVCDTLGLEADNLFLGSISIFRNKLEQDPSMFSKLEIYDIVGPVIANIINGDKEIALELFNSSIIPVCNDLFKGDYTSALLRYTNMTKKLIEKYNGFVSIGMDVFKMSQGIGQVRYGNQYKKSLNFGVPFRR